MRFPTHKQVEEMRALYPKGTRIELVKMDDVQAPEALSSAWMIPAA